MGLPDPDEVLPMVGWAISTDAKGPQRRRLHGLVFFTSQKRLFNVRVKFRPPHIHSCWGNHMRLRSGVSTMKSAFLPALGTITHNFPQYATLIKGQFEKYVAKLRSHWSGHPFSRH